MGAPSVCYSPSRHWLTYGLVAIGGAGLSTWIALQWSPTASIAAVLFLALGAILVALAMRPPIEITETHIAIGNHIIYWTEIERVDRTSWVSPLVIHITLASDKTFWLVYPGDIDGGKGLLRHVRRYARFALIDGIPYRQFWGEILPPGQERRQLPSPKYQLLRAEDEAEVERMFQRLKAVGNLDPKSSDEK